MHGLFFWTFGGFLGLGTFKPIWSNKLIQIPLFGLNVFFLQRVKHKP